MFKFSIT